MALIAKEDAKAKLDSRFNGWNSNGTWGRAYNCGYDDKGDNTDWVTDVDMAVLRANWDKKTAKGCIYRTTASSSSFTIDFLCHTKKPSDGTGFNFHLTQKKA